MKDNTYSPKTTFLKILYWGMLFAIFHIVLDRALAYVSVDVALRSLLRPLDISIIVCDALGFFVCYALLLSSVCRFGIKQSFSSALLVIALSFFKHIGNWMVFLVLEDVSEAYNIRLSALNAASSILIELLQHAILFCLFAILLSPRRKGKAPEKIGIAATSGVLLLINLFSRLALDLDYGAPSSSAEAWLMVGYYLFDILLYGLVGYLTVRRVFYREYKKSEPSEA